MSAKCVPHLIKIYQNGALQRYDMAINWLKLDKIK